LFSQPVLVALDTDQGVIYAPASGWDKVCLLWTFRNFRSLPQTVLSPRQRRLISSLYRQASDYPSNEWHQAAIVGTVEGFRPSSLPTRAASARARKLVAERSPIKSASVPGRQPFYARFAFTGMTLKIATALLVIAIAVLAWHQLGAQPVADSRPTQTAVAVRADVVLPNNEQSTSANVAAVSGNLQNTTAHMGIAVRAVQRSAAPAESAAKPSSVSRKPDQSDASPHPQEANGGRASSPVLTRPIGKDRRRPPSSITSPASLVEAMADQPRMQISGRPRKLVYPVCPETSARGQVSLQAVVGYDGAVNRIRVLTGDRTLAAAAIEAVRQWRYEPFSGSVPPLERETNITISFISNEVVAVSFLASTPVSR
jgi:outer membrane biosynthesis protein TonB